MSALNDAHSWVTSILRLGRGLMLTGTRGRRPEKMLELFEFEACPYCRKVREVLSELDLEYLCHPCTRGSRHRAGVRARGGREMFPYLVDPNTGVEMYQSEDIITYLMETYGTGRTTVGKLLAPVNTLSSTLASAFRPMGAWADKTVKDRRDPEAPLELYGFEASPYCRKVREALNSLDLQYIARNVAKRSPRRASLVSRGGKMMVPYLIDSNTGSELYESDDIVAYLRTTYRPRG